LDKFIYSIVQCGNILLDPKIISNWSLDNLVYTFGFGSAFQINKSVEIKLVMNDEDDGENIS